MFPRALNAKLKVVCYVGDGMMRCNFMMLLQYILSFVYSQYEKM